MEKSSTADVLIIGAGVIGLATGYELAKRGAKVVLLERNAEVGQEASWAAAGFLMQRVTTKDAYGWLARTSRSLYPTLTADLLEVTGLDIEYRPYGGLDVALTEQRASSLQRFLPFQQQRGLRAEWLETRDALALEPRLTPANLGAVLFADDAQVRPPRLTRALRLAVEKHNGRIFTNTPVREIVRDGDGRVLGARTAAMRFSAATTLLTAGCWSGELAAQVGLNLPVRPVRGQMCLVDAPVGTIRRTVGAEGVYLAQRDDGTFLIGSTVEEAGFDKATTDEGQREIREGAIRTCPMLAECRVLRTWAGLRPAPARRLPYIYEALPGLWVATGHFRQGILLAPGTALLLAENLTGGKSPAPLGTFHPRRDTSNMSEK